MNAKPVPTSQRSLVWPIAIAAIVVLGVIAVIAARGSNAKDDSFDEAAQTSTVTISGDALTPLVEGQAADEAVGKVVPAATGKDFHGKKVTVGPEGGAKVVMFLAHWCPHCQAEMPRILSHIDDTPLPDGVELVMVSTGVKPDADNYPPQTWIEKAGWKGTVLADSEEGAAATAYGLTSFPYFVAVKADGTVAARISGEITNGQFADLVTAAQGG